MTSPSLRFCEGALARRRKALSRLAHQRAILAPLRDEPGFGVFPLGDRRRRALVRLSGDDVHALAAEGAITEAEGRGGYALSSSGRARLGLGEDGPASSLREPSLASTRMEHASKLVDRGDGRADEPIGRLLRMSAASPGFLFSGREIAAARTVWTQVRSRPGAEKASDEAALASLPAAMAAAVKAFCADETGVEALERRRRWPARSGKVVLKLALELLADHYRLA